MARLTIDAEGNIELGAEILKHLGAIPGDTLNVELFAYGRILLAVERPGTIDDFIGLLAGKGARPIAIQEINEATADGWAGTTEASQD